MRFAGQRDRAGRLVLRLPLRLRAGDNHPELPPGNVATGLNLPEVRLDTGADKADRLVQRLQVEWAGISWHCLRRK